MTWGDINSGAVPQPGGVVYHGPAGEAKETTAQEEVAQATQDALNGEGAFSNVEAGIKEDVERETAVTQPVVEKDDEKASGVADGEEGEGDRQGYIPVTEADDQAASAGESEDGDKEQPAKSANKGEWAEFAGLSEEEADSMTKDEIIEKYGK